MVSTVRGELDRGCLGPQQRLGGPHQHPPRARWEPLLRPRAGTVGSNTHLVLRARLRLKAVVIIFINKATEGNFLPPGLGGGTFLASFTTGNRAWF